MFGLGLADTNGSQAALGKLVTRRATVHRSGMDKCSRRRRNFTFALDAASLAKMHTRDQRSAKREILYSAYYPRRTEILRASRGDWGKLGNRRVFV